MIERHYFRSRLIKSFDFSFNFCIPNSTNEWECIYDVPKLDEKLCKKIIILVNDIAENPYETISDSFYFVGNEMIMHNKVKLIDYTRLHTITTFLIQ